MKTAELKRKPIEFYVDCMVGETVNDAILSAGDLPNTLIITISGTCYESVFILRSNVTLIGENPTEGISGTFSVLASRGASHIEVESMTLGGGTVGLACFSGATVTARNANIVNSGTGVLAIYGGNCDISDSTIENNGHGLTLSSNSQVWLRGVDVTTSANSTTSNMGANVLTGSSITIGASPTDSSPSTFSNYYRGLQVTGNGSVRISQAIFENNQADGIWASSGSSVFIDTNASVEIRNNGRHGISISNLATATLSGGVNVSDNGEFGLECIGTHHIAYTNSPTYYGNGNGPTRASCDIAF